MPSQRSRHWSGAIAMRSRSNRKSSVARHFRNETTRTLEPMYTDDIIDGLEVIARRRGQNILQGDVLIVEAAIKALKRRGADYVAIGHLHRPSGRLTGDGSVQFIQDVFSIPLPV